MENVSLEKILLIRGESEPKRVEYQWGLGNKKGEVVYQVRDNKVIFSAIISSREAPSTVNAAEAVVVAICEAEGINWKAPSFYKDYEFYDLSTPLGYPGRKENPFLWLTEDLGEVQIDRLEIKPHRNYLHVESWTPVHLNSGSQARRVEPPVD